MSTHAFTREELYDLIWSEPMQKVALRFGLSGRGLAKACERADIPVPPRGYWNKRMAGHKVNKAPLPPPTIGTPHTVCISPPGPRPEPTPPTTPSPTVREAIEAELRPEAKVDVPRTLSSPHRIVEAWIKEDEHRRQQYRQDPWLRQHYEPIQSTPLQKRKMRILSALLKALEARGYTITPNESINNPILIQNRDAILTVLLNERIRQYRRYLSEEEKAKRNDFTTNRTWTQEREPTGELRLTVAEVDRRWTIKTWRDETDQPIEHQMNNILGGIAGCLEEIRLRREQEAIEHERRWKADQARLSEERENKREAIRFQRLVSQVSDWKLADQIRQFVTTVEVTVRDIRDQKRIDEWKHWALEHANQIDPLNGAAIFDQEVSDWELMRPVTRELVTRSD